MTTAEFHSFVDELAEQGYTEVLTGAGWISLGEWHPYGLFGGVNDNGMPTSLRFIQDDYILREEAHPVAGMTQPMLFGQWELRGDQWREEAEHNYNRSLGV